jgi:hypothetical protein
MFTNLIQLGYLSIVIWVVIGNRLIYRKANPWCLGGSTNGQNLSNCSTGCQNPYGEKYLETCANQQCSRRVITQLKRNHETQSEFQSTADCPKVFNIIKYPIGDLAMSWFLVEQDFIRVHPLNNPTTLWFFATFVAEWTDGVAWVLLRIGQSFVGPFGIHWSFNQNWDRDQQ